MKTLWKPNLLYKCLSLALAAVLGLGTLAFLPGIALASSTAQATATPPAQASPLLEKALQREKQWLTTQEGQIQKASDASKKVLDLIDQAKAKGQDTSALESALAVFQSQLASAQAAHQTASDLLDSHAGFDANGKVTDRVAARQTVLEARQSLADAHQFLVQAVRDLRAAARTWRQALRQKASEALLEKAYARENDWLKQQGNNLAKTGPAVTRVQGLIDQAKGQGKDTSSLEAALATYKSQIATAQASHDTAQKILVAHTGFDANGKVTDNASARETVQDARQSLNDVRLALVQSTQDLQAAVRQWRNANPPAATPSGSNS